MNNIVENNTLKTMPPNWEMNLKEVEIELLSNQPRLHNRPINELNKFRMMVFINNLSEIPPETIINKRYFISY